MAQNTSHAVMNQRVEPHDSLDDFPTPPWATRALCEYVINQSGNVWEPACNRGHMVKPLQEYFDDVQFSDVHDYGGHTIFDFLMPASHRVCGENKYDWIVTNPPFRLAEQFALTAINRARLGVALFVRSNFLESIGRYNRLFDIYPPSTVAQFTERVVLHKGKLTATGSTATAYCWIVWNYPFVDKNTEFVWIPPCRKQLEKAADYLPEVE